MAEITSQYNTQAKSPIDVRSESGINIKFETLCEKALAHTRLLWIGDTSHGNPEIEKTVFSESAMKSYVTGGAKHFFAEGSVELKDALAALSSNLSFDEFMKSFLEKQGLDISILDSAAPEMKAFFNEKISKIRNIFDSGMQYHPVDPEPESANVDLMLKGDTSIKQVVQRLKLDALLGKNVESALPEGEKGLLVYGAQHGSRFGDDLFENGKLNSIKISIYPDAKHYADSLANNIKFNKDVDRIFPGNKDNYGEESPQAVYFIDTGKVYFSATAPQALVDDVKNQTSAPEISKPTVTRPVTSSQ